MSLNHPIRLAVVGGHRGKAFNRALSTLEDRVQLVAVCDLKERVLAGWKETFPDIHCYNSYERLLDEETVDAVFLATPVQLHATQAIQAMRAGKHVLTEVIAAITLDECWELVETVETTGLTYMMAENYCYMRENALVSNMVQQGVFGDITFAECGYIHDVRYLAAHDDGSLTWRGQMLKEWQATSYPTHSIGPVAQWLGINRDDGDRFTEISTRMSKASGVATYFRERFGEDHPGSDVSFWRLGDSQVSLITTANGALVVLRTDLASPRPHNMRHYGLQGTQAAYLSGRHGKEDPLIWIEGRSQGDALRTAAMEWESLWQYADEYEHPMWRQWMEEASQAGHGGGDFFVLREFADAIFEKRRPSIDVYDAVTWSAIVPLSAESVRQGGAPVQFPDFLRRRA